MKPVSKVENEGLLLMILSVCFGFVLYLFYELTRPSNIKDLSKRINNGFDEDKRNMASDWNKVKADLQAAQNKNML